MIKGESMLNEDVIHLQSAHITQYTDETGRTAWKVRKNITSEDLAELPKDLTEDEVFKVMGFARKFELIAFNEGIKLGKQELKVAYDSMVAQLQRELQLMRGENERLATKLEKFILSEVEV